MGYFQKRINLIITRLIIFILIGSNNLNAQNCNGTWSLQRPASFQCVTGQWVGWQNTNNPIGCPTSPTYIGTESNTFTFNNPVSSFSIDFIGIDGTTFCPRIELRVNGVFYLLTATNLTDFPENSTCTTGSFNNIILTPDGYITESAFGGNGFIGRGRITINNINAVNVTVSTNDVNGTVFSDPFNCTSIVPLKLLSFEGNSFLCNTDLTWKSGTEINVANIEVHRSGDGVTFQKIGQVAPKGSNSDYTFSALSNNDSYYRLKMIDVDGSFEFSRILYINSGCAKDIYLVIPNPAGDFVEISNLNTSDKVIVIDAQGKQVKYFHPPLNTKLNIQSLSPGLYIFHVIDNGNRKAAIKVVKK